MEAREIGKLQAAADLWFAEEEQQETRVLEEATAEVLGPRADLLDHSEEVLRKGVQHLLDASERKRFYSDRTG
jgi:hypothetical protein